MNRAPGARRLLLAVLGLLAACRGTGPVALRDLTEGRLVQLRLVEKATGRRRFLYFFAKEARTLYLEGYIRGKVTDYAGSPIQGVVVRAEPSGPGADPASAGVFDPGVTDSEGTYRVRFSIPVRDGTVDAKGRLLFNPGWEQERAVKGQSYEPQAAASAFRLYYDEDGRLAHYSDELSKVVVQPVAGAGALPGKAGPARAPAKAGPPPPAPEDLLRGFGLGP
jgi:hypothetical protein